MTTITQEDQPTKTQPVKTQSKAREVTIFRGSSRRGRRGTDSQRTSACSVLPVSRKVVTAKKSCSAKEAAIKESRKNLIIEKYDIGDEASSNSEGFCVEVTVQELKDLFHIMKDKNLAREITELFISEFEIKTHRIKQAVLKSVLLCTNLRSLLLHDINVPLNIPELPKLIRLSLDDINAKVSIHELVNLRVLMLGGIYSLNNELLMNGKFEKLFSVSLRNLDDRKKLKWQEGEEPKRIKWLLEGSK